MVNLSIKIKKILVIFVLLVCGVLLNNVHAQNIRLKVSKDSTLIDGKYIYSIDIKIKGGNPPYNVELYNNLLREGGKLIAKEENVSLSVVHFSNLDACKTLYISVECINQKQGVTTLIKL